MIFKVNRKQKIHRAIYDLKSALGLSRYDKWQYNLTPYEDYFEIDVNNACLPKYQMEEDIFLWKMKYQ